MDIDFTPRGIAKYAATAVVGNRTARFAEHVIVDRTGRDKDSLLVEIPSNLIGAYVAHKLTPVTNYAVDKAADQLVELRKKFENRRNQNTEETK